jgi:pyruvate kinase
MSTQTFSELQSAIHDILLHIRETEYSFREAIAAVHPGNRERARNFVHYLALRSFDLRKIQGALSELGISSLAHAEGYTLYNVLRVEHLLHLVDGGQDTFLERHQDNIPPYSYDGYLAAFREQIRRLFGGQADDNSHTRLMVTLPSDAASDYELVLHLAEAGMNVARINTSHDNPESWASMVEHVRKAQEATGADVRIYMDLSGPKIRTDFSDIRLWRKKRWLTKKQRLLLQKDDRIVLCKNPKKWKPEDDGAKPVAAFRCTEPSILKDIQTGDRIFFDDGKLGGLIEQNTQKGAVIRITQAALEGSKLRHRKGINLPDTQLRLPSLTDRDHEHLPTIAKMADMVGYSFVRQPSDVQELQDQLSKLGRADLGIILKIETREAFRQFPGMILQALQSPSVGVMIARGDLAVEIGFERIAEVQEEIMWLSEAALVPDIWATQVLESLVKKGQATRGDITDAAMAARASCVMLNKGPNIVEAVRILRNITDRMAQHQQRKHGSLRPLAVATDFIYG